ncbi:MAG: OmpH family outer membrane protein [Flavobacteriales bacterium]|jgi:outer membrane protein|nr:OmpH family outer membrane protein [Flavobacteriales bacterium]
MKTLILSLGLLLSAAPAAMAQKLGHIDRQQLMLMLPERKDAEAKMQAFAAELDNRLRAMGTEYEQKVTEAQGRQGTMTNTERDVAVREIQELEQRIQAAQQKAQEDLAKQEEELLRPMVERTNQAIREVADAGGYTYIFDTSAGFVLYWDKGDDILPKVKTKLGI